MAVCAAQLYMDPKIPGVTAFFSGLSRDKASGYRSDKDTIHASERCLCQFLISLCARSSAKKTHLPAHSMGSRAIFRVAMRAAEYSHQLSRLSRSIRYPRPALQPA